MLLRVIFINVVLTVTNVFAQIQIDSNFDSGNIGTYTGEGKEFIRQGNNDKTHAQIRKTQGCISAGRTRD